MKYTEQIDLLELEIMKFNQSDSRRIQHLVKVHRFAQLIGHMEKLDAHTQFLTECAALVHDIGIRPAEEKYGACNGKLQEQEGTLREEIKGILMVDPVQEDDEHALEEALQKERKRSRRYGELLRDYGIQKKETQ